MYKTLTRAAFEVALAAAPTGQVQSYVRRAIARRAGTRAPRVVRKERVPQEWSGKRAATEFFNPTGGRP